MTVEWVMYCRPISLSFSKGVVQNATGDETHQAINHEQLVNSDDALHIVGSIQPTSPREQRRQIKNRHARFQKAVKLAYKRDWPFTLLITVNWHALVEAGEHNEGHCLGKTPRNRESYLRSELRRICRLRDLPFVALWGRDVGKRMGAHVHIAMFFPTRWLNFLVGHIERICGSHADFLDEPYREREIRGVMRSVAARSVCGGWQIDTICGGINGALLVAEYIAGQHEKTHHSSTPGRQSVRGVTSHRQNCSRCK